MYQHRCMLCQMVARPLDPGVIVLDGSGLNGASHAYVHLTCLDAVTAAKQDKQMEVKKLE